MVAYEFYVYDEKGELDFFGIHPERRKDPLRITQESIMKWGKSILAFDGCRCQEYLFRSD